MDRLTKVIWSHHVSVEPNPGTSRKSYYCTGTAGLSRSGMFPLSTTTEDNTPSGLHCLAVGPGVLNLLHSTMSLQLSSRKWIYERFYLLCCLMKNTDEVRNWETLVRCPHTWGPGRRWGNDMAWVIDVCSLIDWDVRVTFILPVSGLTLLYSWRTVDSHKVSNEYCDQGKEFILPKLKLPCFWNWVSGRI
jgi:hypothetical protein